MHSPRVFIVGSSISISYSLLVFMSIAIIAWSIPGSGLGIPYITSKAALEGCRAVFSGTIVKEMYAAGYRMAAADKGFLAQATDVSDDA